MKSRVKEVLLPTAVLTLICVIVAAALAGTNLLTREKIAEQAEKKAGESRALVLPEAKYFEEAPDGSHTIGLDAEGGVAVGYVFEASAKGYGGDVSVMTGINTEGKITGVVILSHEETPGLGANAEKEDFRAQFLQDVPPDGLELVKYQTPAAGQVEAITGASMTSGAVTDAVNQAIESYQNTYASEGGND